MTTAIILLVKELTMYVIPLSCNSKNVIDVAYCIKCKVFVQLHPGNHAYRFSKSTLKRKKILRRFIENCNNNGFNNLRFEGVDCLNNVDRVKANDIDDFPKRKLTVKSYITRY